MPEAWEITKSDSRDENQIIVFIIFCEDQNDEPYYFRSFQVENKIKINCIPNQKQAKLEFDKYVIFCEAKGLLECVDHELRKE